jgi:lysozyme family protein
MTPGAELQYELGRAATTLRRRLGSTADAQEQQLLGRVVAQLNVQIAALDQADLLATAATLADAVEILETVVGAVRHGPFDGYLAALENHFDNLFALSGNLHGFDALPPAPAGEAPAPSAAAAPKKRQRAAATRLPPPSTSTDFASLQDEYAQWYAACKVRPERRGELAYYLKRLAQGQAVYQQLATELAIPWAFIGITHGMECGFNFKTHLHNGDPLSSRTAHVPAGRPTTGNPPFTWNQSARDALIYKGYHQIGDWSAAHMLYLFERYNGMGYRRRGLPTPYLWSYSTLYEKGKFVADGHFDPQAVSKQCGAALILKAVMN